MSTIGNRTLNSNANLLAQLLANVSARQVINKNQSLPVSDSSVPTRPDRPDSQLASFIAKWTDTRLAIDKLGKVTQEISQSKKAFAAEVLKRIKEQIRLMMLMTAGDPKARARQIAALARELASAAREYASVSGDSSQANEASAAKGTVVQNVNTSSTDQGNATKTIGATASDTTVKEQPEQNTPDASPVTSTTTTAGPSESIPRQSSTHQTDGKFANIFSEYGRISSTSKEDQEFAMEVKKLAAQLKALAKQNEVRTHKGNNQSTERETADTNDALREVERSVAAIDSTGGSPTPSINIMAG